MFLLQHWARCLPLTQSSDMTGSGHKYHHRGREARWVKKNLYSFYAKVDRGARCVCLPDSGAEDENKRYLSFLLPRQRGQRVQSPLGPHRQQLLRTLITHHSSLVTHQASHPLQWTVLTGVRWRGGLTGMVSSAGNSWAGADLVCLHSGPVLFINQLLLPTTTVRARLLI